MGQTSRLVIGFHGTAPGQESIKRLKRLIDAKKVAGVIFFRRNIQSEAQLKSLIKYLRKGSEDLWVGIDMEGGLVNRFSASKFPSAQYFSAEKMAMDYSPNAAYLDYESMAKFLFDLGFNINYGVVLDLAVPGAVITKQGRCFSEDPYIVAAYAEAMMDAHRTWGISAVLKHFPGQGSMSKDTHKDLVVLDNYDSTDDELPYRLLAKKADAIMLGHVQLLSRDPDWPATMSAAHVQYMKANYGDSCLLITDDMSMGALSRFPIETRIARATEAGYDQILLAHISAADAKALDLAI